MYHIVLGKTIHCINQGKVILFLERIKKSFDGLYLHKISSCLNHNK